MGKDTKVCPFCHDLTMEPAEELGKGWLKCSKCGATKQFNPTKRKNIADMDTWRDKNDVRHYPPFGVHG